jgi:hypothetical protein
MQNLASSDTKAIRHLQVQCMTPGAACINLTHQFIKLRSAGCGLVGA